jgi:deoxycytidylate deaminase
MRAVHAEQKMMINARVAKVVYQQSYPDGTALDFLQQAGIDVARMKGKN